MFPNLYKKICAKCKHKEPVKTKEKKRNIKGIAKSVYKNALNANMRSLSKYNFKIIDRKKQNKFYKIVTTLLTMIETHVSKHLFHYLSKLLNSLLTQVTKKSFIVFQ